MSMIENIQANQLAARIAKNQIKSNLLTTLLGEARSIGKNNGNRETTDEEVIKLITKFIKGITETLSLLKPEDSRFSILVEEQEILKSYLPTQLTTEEIKFIILKNFPEKTAVGPVMAFFKSNYSGLYDGKAVSSLINNLY